MELKKSYSKYLENNFVLQPTSLFLEQLDSLSSKSQRILEKKFILLKINPFRNKKIKGHGKFLFRIRFKDENKEKRIIYLVDDT